MSHIRSRKHLPGARPLTVAALATSLAFALPSAAFAADTVAADAPADQHKDQEHERDGHRHHRDEAKNLDKVDVHGSRIQAKAVASPKFTQSLQDTPQTIQVITSDLFNQQGATTLTEALRNTPGVGAFYAGENGNTSTGDTIYMRGFDSSSSIFIDGVRDLGSISRDLFNIDQVEVEKGPAGTDNGRSAPSGAINMVSKRASLREAISGTVSGGDEGQKRGTADWNQTLGGGGAALRLNAMWQDSDTPGRDHVNNKRWGLAPSLGFNLDGATRYWLNLYYVKQDNVPDGFVPTIGLPGWTPQPGLAQLAGHPVDPENYYGTRQDHDDVEAKQATFIFEHDFSDTLKLTNTARWGETTQDYLLTSFMGTGVLTAGNPTGNIQWTDINDLSTYTLARSSNTFKDQRNKILTDQFNLRADFATGSIEHNLSTGIELTREEQYSRNFGSTGARPAASLYNPDWNDVGNLVYFHNGTGSYGKTDTASVFAFDTLKFGENFLITGGVRFDHYKTEYENTAICNNGTGRGAVPCNGAPVGSAVSTVDTDTSDTLFNWKLGAVYKVGDDVSLYANWALSQQPPGGANFALASADGAANSINADPQKAKTFEVGTKWNVLENLAVNLALFQTDVTNEINANVVDDFGNPTQTGEKKVKGVELSAVGNITDNWTISAGYTSMTTDVTEGPVVNADGTSGLSYTPDDAFTSWTSYRLPFGLTIGGGVRYSGQMHRGTDGAVGTPAFTKSYTVYDAVASYDISRNVTVRLNGYNLFDKEYVAAINKSGYRYTPGTPRTFLLSADFRF
ncbi:catecholate siderophore receptor [Pseudoxanthomonas sp. GM95]|uniref:catecholate siderophore receptor Fiu n=1 Tax=Pseudoxanthomonas sp. GM95 TaxID=1881043 RepID=UPI0008D737D8|nr:catecholate siderophore receptor Fiu [Pseudoxanthomonas sp. GM95]SEL76961.1 catecholate siderophore receptor [Pseudoxanthomonas sp. GM95]